MSKKIDLTGKVFGRLTVIKEAGRNNSSLLWLLYERKIKFKNYRKKYNSRIIKD